MPASYPSAVKSFTTKNTGDTIQASHIDDLQDEVTAIETGLLTGTARLNSSNSTLATLSVTGGSTLLTLNVNGGSTFAGVANIAGVLSALSGIVLAGSEVSTGPLGGSTAWTDMAVAAGTVVFHMNPSGNVTLSGLATPGQVHGRTLLLLNVTAASTVNLMHNQGSAAANRFAISDAGAANVPIGPNKGIWVYYSTLAGTFWRMAGL